MKNIFLKLVLGCLVIVWCLSIYKASEFMYETHDILEKHKREFTVLRLELDFQRSKLEDTNTILEQVMNR